jgi:hypothetical protein
MDESPQGRLGGTGHKPTRGKVFMLDGWEVRLYKMISSRPNREKWNWNYKMDVDNDLIYGRI